MVRLENASLASQAVGPPLSDFEMSFRGRTWPKIGKKMLSLPPLAKQAVHPRDSVLGSPLAKSTEISGVITLIKGLNTTYSAMIQAAFQPQYWNNTTQMVTFAPDGTSTHFHPASRPAHHQSVHPDGGQFLPLFRPGGAAL